MMKKILVLLSMVGVLSFTSCGSSSDEAKELLQKILQFIGIPQNIIVQVCQDANKNGICNLNEAKTKVTINEGDSVDEILEKITLTADGKYFIETYNPEFPILVELQDVAKVNFDGGKFTLEFNGFKTKEDDNETKEISILESMVDANALSKTIADTFRTLRNAEAQEKYYVALLGTLESNINILRTQGLDSQIAVRASIKEMGDESTTNQGQTDRINACANNQVCVDGEVKTLSDELLITDAEAEEIKVKEETTQNNTTVDSFTTEYLLNKTFYRIADTTTDSAIWTYNYLEGNVVQVSIYGGTSDYKYTVSNGTVTIDENLGGGNDDSSHTKVLIEGNVEGKYNLVKLHYLYLNAPDINIREYFNLSNANSFASSKGGSTSSPTTTTP